MNRGDAGDLAPRVAGVLQRVRLAAEPLIDASETARRLGVSRTTVYARSNELGALRLGSGPKARLRFDPVRVREALVEASARPQTAGDEPVARRPRRKTRPGTHPLLPIKGRMPQ